MNNKPIISSTVPLSCWSTSVKTLAVELIDTHCKVDWRHLLAVSPLFDYRLPAPIAKVGRFPLNWCVFSAIQPVICCGFFFPSSLKQAHTENFSNCTCTLSRAVNGGKHWLLLKSIALLVHYSFVLADPPMCLLLLWSPSRGRQKWRPTFTSNPTFKCKCFLLSHLNCTYLHSAWFTLQFKLAL